jgi:hypothetical protein
MGRPRNPCRFTKKETIERLQAAKSYLGNKERLAFTQTCSIYVPAGYKPDEDESYYAAPKLSQLDIQCLTDETKGYCSAVYSDNYNWRTDCRFKAVNAPEFAECEFRKGASIGQSVVVIFYPWKDASKVSKVATLWLGTWHHAPIVVWSSGSSIKVNPLPQYIDLIH